MTVLNGREKVIFTYRSERVFSRTPVEPRSGLDDTN